MRHVLALYLLVLAFPLAAQLDRATVTGTVTDASGAIVPGVHITIRNTANGGKFETISSSIGQYTQAGLPIGDYELRFDAQGFKKLTLSHVNLQAGDVARLDTKLDIGSVTESVEVTAQSSRLQTDTPEVSAALDGKALADLPLSFNGGRHADNFAFSMADIIGNLTCALLD